MESHFQYRLKRKDLTGKHSREKLYYCAIVNSGARSPVGMEHPAETCQEGKSQWQEPGAEGLNTWDPCSLGSALTLMQAQSLRAPPLHSTQPGLLHMRQAKMSRRRCQNGPPTKHCCNCITILCCRNSAIHFRTPVLAAFFLFYFTNECTEHAMMTAKNCSQCASCLKIQKLWNVYWGFLSIHHHCNVYMLFA